MLKRIVLTSFRSIGIFFECFVALIIVYFLCYWTLSRIPVNSQSKSKTPRTTVIYLTSNGVHTDFVVPIVNEQKNWGNALGLTNDFKQDTTRNWIAIGWGDKNFFLKTKNWSDLTVSTALKATFGLGTGAVHVVQRSEPNPEESNTIKLKISREEYIKLCKYIEGNFVRKGKNLSPIEEHPYSQFDFFFDANSTYSLWYTCNSWTNSGLKASNQKACLWTPFKDGIFEKYGK